ncbi:ferritin family protein [Chloroflexota bacterium]
MSISFSGNELINIAIGIERTGIAFYDIMARSTRNGAVSEVFQYLADAERQHIQVFQGLLTDADKYQVTETYVGEYAAYVKALVDSAVFTDDFATGEMANRAESDIEAIELAINGEKDSILFYYEMKEIMPHPAQSMVNQIITEEKSHLRQLFGLKKELASK